MNLAFQLPRSPYMYADFIYRYHPDFTSLKLDYKCSLSDAKEQLNNLISFIQQSNNEETAAHHDHLRHLHELITKEMSSKSEKMKTVSFF